MHADDGTLSGVNVYFFICLLLFPKAERHRPPGLQLKETQGIRVRVETFGEDYPAGGYEVLSKPPLGNPKVLSPAEATFQRMAGKAMKAATPPPPKQEVPEETREDWSWMTEEQRRKAETAARKLLEQPVIVPRSMSPSRFDIPSTEPFVQAPAKGVPLEIIKSPFPTEAKASSPTGGQVKGEAKASQPMDDRHPMVTRRQEKGEAKASQSNDDRHPMVTRRQEKRTGSRAGGFRGVVGSGQIGAVCGS
jgi:hypothetical protein